jgi:hypothetical protein
VSISSEVGAGARKRGEPHGRERGATNPRTGCGESRRGGAKPRGRNGSRGVEPPARSHAGRFVGWRGGSGRIRDERRRGVCGQGHERMEPAGTRPGASVPAGVASAPGEVKVTRVDLFRSRGRGRSPRDHLGGPARKRSTAEEGAGKSNDQLPTRSPGSRHCPPAATPRRPEDHANAQSCPNVHCLAQARRESRTGSNL